MSLNIFDACVGVAVLIAVTTGFNSGLLRTLASILAYAAAAPIAVATAPLLAPAAADGDVSSTQSSLVLAGIFLAAGVVLGKLLRLAIDTTFGPSAALPDRVAGALLGAVRVGLVAIALVLVFDVLIPPDQQPDFLVGSTLRPWLSLAARTGLKSLPPALAGDLDGLKQAGGSPDIASGLDRLKQLGGI